MLALDLGRDKEEAQQKTRPEKLSSHPDAWLCLSRVEEGKKHTDNGLFPGRRVDDARFWARSILSQSRAGLFRTMKVVKDKARQGLLVNVVLMFVAVQIL